MLNLLETLRRMQLEIEDCEIAIYSSTRGINVAATWTDGSRYQCARMFTAVEIKAAVNPSMLVDYFIIWAKEMRRDHG